MIVDRFERLFDIEGEMRLTLPDVNFFEATASKLNRRLASKSLLVPDLGLAQLISAG